MEIPGGVALLIEDTPEIEFRGPFVIITDGCGIKRAMPREVAIQAYALFAQRLREDRLGRADIIPFRREYSESA